MNAVAENILETLPDLPPEQLRELVSRATYLLDPTGQDANPAKPRQAGHKADADQQLVCKELETLLGHAGDRRALPLTVLLKSGAGKAFCQGVPLFMDFIRSEFGPARQVQTVKVVRVLLRCIATDLTRRSVPVCPRTVSQGLARVAAVVDKSFPGYREAGLLPFLLKRATLPA